MIDWHEYSIVPRWPEDGYAVIDEHGHEYARGDMATVRVMLQSMRLLQDQALEQEEAWSS